MELKLNRLMLMLNRHIIMDSKKYLRGILSGLVLALLITCLGLTQGYVNMNTFYSITIGAFGIGGAVLSSTIFRELGDSNTGYQFIALPASNLEKYVSAWVISYLLYSLLSIGLIFMGGFLLNSLKVFDVSIIGDAYRVKDVFDVVYLYLFVNALFLFGAAAFKSHALVKTVLSVGAIILSLFLVGLAVFGVMFLLGAYPDKAHMGFYGDDIPFSIGDIENAKVLEKIGAFALFSYLHIVGLLKLKEREL